MSLLLLISFLILALISGIFFALGLKRVAIACSFGMLLLLLANVAFYFAIANARM